MGGCGGGKPEGGGDEEAEARWAGCAAVAEVSFFHSSDPFLDRDASHIHLYMDFCGKGKGAEYSIVGRKKKSIGVSEREIGRPRRSPKKIMSFS